ncbi:ABC transporter permease [Agrobacterium rhizogenes]|uniref:ABC transporter permease n=1 Tax=Rhizobium rhizogenes TaxID=359 RepID=UPI001573BCB7|nr:ABC transporter permease [Rhizobium rhizogenes]NTH16607.1 ABC transporter permease [Rhizobium rhizogenes]
MNPIKFLTGRIETSVIFGALLLIIVLVISTHGQWLNNVPSVLRVTAQVGIIAIGQSLLMTSGEVDLSVGSVFAITGVVFIWLTGVVGLNVELAIILSIFAAGAIGLVNGIITTRFQVPSMIVTLGAMFIYRGFTFLATQGASLSLPRETRHDPVLDFVKAKFFGLNVPVYALAVLCVIFVFVLAKTRLGNHITAVGGNYLAALANGISPHNVRIRAFVLCSTLAGLSGLLILFQEGSVYSTSGIKMELESIAACVIGGCTLRGGVGSVWGAVLGVFILSSLKGGLMMLGAPTSWYAAFVGAILVGFLVLARILNQRTGGVQ